MTSPGSLQGPDKADPLEELEGSYTVLKKTNKNKDSMLVNPVFQLPEYVRVR